MRITSSGQPSLPRPQPWRPSFGPPPNRSNTSHLPQRSVAVTASVVNWLPILCLTLATGLLQVSLANSAARSNWPYAEALWWLGLIVIYAPTVLHLLRVNVSREERLVLVLLLGLTLYGVKVVNTPLHPAYHDEFAHLRVAVNILNTHHLFSYAPQLPVTPLYPGMEIATVTLARLSGLDLYPAGLVLIGCGRLVLMLSLFLLFERVSSSSRIAGIATVVYAANPNYLLFDAQFSYESLALPLAIMLVSMLTRRMVTGTLNQIGFNIASVMLLAALTVTHHLTSYMVMATLALWVIIGFILSALRLRRDQTVPLWVLIFALALNATWLLYVANFTLRYLVPIFSQAFEGLLNAVEAGGVKRLPFQTAEGSQAAPLLERLLGLASAGLVTLMLPFGIAEVWRRHRHKATALMLALTACLYPATLLLRFTGGGWEISNRTSEFLFIGIGLLVALTLTDLKLTHWLHTLRKTLAMPALVMIFLGAIVIGWSPWMRLKWPYLVVADYRSIEPQGMQAAYWAKATLGRYNVMAGDRINNMLMAGLGEQNTISGNGFTTAGIFLKARLDKSELDVLRRAQIRYLVVDRRLSTAFPKYGYYFQSWERDVWPYRSPIQQNILEKWDYIDGTQKIFDSGDIRIYDVGVLSNDATQ